MYGSDLSNDGGLFLHCVFGPESGQTISMSAGWQLPERTYGVSNRCASAFARQLIKQYDLRSGTSPEAMTPGPAASFPPADANRAGLP